MGFFAQALKCTATSFKYYLLYVSCLRSLSKVVVLMSCGVRRTNPSPPVSLVLIPHMLLLKAKRIQFFQWRFSLAFVLDCDID